MGWNVDVPSITRRTDKGLPQYRDAEESDEFVLSGAEVLVPALLKGSLGRDELDEGGFHVVRYRPRIEGAFARIEKRTENATGEIHWRTVTNDNVTSLYGRSPGARIADPKEARRVYAWRLEMTFDDRGNVVWFESTSRRMRRAFPRIARRRRAASVAHRASRISTSSGFDTATARHSP